MDRFTATADGEVARTLVAEVVADVVSFGTCKDIIHSNRGTRKATTQAIDAGFELPWPQMVRSEMH